MALAGVAQEGRGLAQRTTARPVAQETRVPARLRDQVRIAGLAPSEGDLSFGRAADVAVLIDGVGGDRVRVALDEAVGAGAGAGAGVYGGAGVGRQPGRAPRRHDP